MAEIRALFFDRDLQLRVDRLCAALAMHSKVVVRIVDDLDGTYYRWMFPSTDLDPKFPIDRHGPGPALKPYYA